MTNVTAQAPQMNGIKLDKAAPKEMCLHATALQNDAGNDADRSKHELRRPAVSQETVIIGQHV